MTAQKIALDTIYIGLITSAKSNFPYFYKLQKKRFLNDNF